MKRIVIGILLGAVIVAGGVLAYGRIFAPDADSPQWTVASYSGDVKASITGKAFEEVSLKLRLQHGDRLRTGDAAEAMLLQANSHVVVRPRTELTVSVLNEEASKFQVAEGIVQVEARGSHISVRTDSGAKVDASDAGLGVTVKPDGFVQVQVARGSAEFSAMGRTEVVQEGQESSARAGQPPSTPVAIPQAILLNVSFPDADTFNARLARVEGRTAPGYRLRIADQWVDVGPDGSWQADVELAEGVNQIEVAASDSLGRSRTERSLPIRVDTTAPTLSGARIGLRSVDPTESRVEARPARPATAPPPGEGG